MTGHGADKSGFARLIAEDAADGADGLTQGTVGDDDVTPDAIEDVPAMHRFAAPLDQKHEQVEVAGNERLFAPVAEQQASPWRESEVVETIPGHRLR